MLEKVCNVHCNGTALKSVLTYGRQQLEFYINYAYYNLQFLFMLLELMIKLTMSIYIIYIVIKKHDFKNKWLSDLKYKLILHT